MEDDSRDIAYLYHSWLADPHWEVYENWGRIDDFSRLDLYHIRLPGLAAGAVRGLIKTRMGGANPQLLADARFDKGYYAPDAAGRQYLVLCRGRVVFYLQAKVSLDLREQLDEAAAILPP